MNSGVPGSPRKGGPPFHAYQNVFTRPSARRLRTLLSPLIVLSQKGAGGPLTESVICRDSQFSMGEAEMGRQISDDSESRFATYVEGRSSVSGHAVRLGRMRDYCVGLMLPCERKSVEQIAAVTAPERTAAQHQSLLHFVGEGRWSDEKVL